MQIRDALCIANGKFSEHSWICNQFPQWKYYQAFMFMCNSQLPNTICIILDGELSWHWPKLYPICVCWILSQFINVVHSFMFHSKLCVDIFTSAFKIFVHLCRKLGRHSFSPLVVAFVVIADVVVVAVSLVNYFDVNVWWYLSLIWPGCKMVESDRKVKITANICIFTRRPITRL